MIKSLSVLPVLLFLFAVPSIAKAECEYDYCGHMTVTYFVMDYSLSTLGFTAAGSGEEDMLPEVEELDQNEVYSMVFDDLGRISTVGDPTVGCANVKAVRKGEAANQIGPRLSQVRIGQAVRINYGTGESELFVIDCKICSMFAEPVPGTCG